MVCTPMRLHPFAIATLSTHAPRLRLYVQNQLIYLWQVSRPRRSYSYLWELKKQPTNIEVVDHVSWLKIKTSRMNMGPIFFHCIRSSATTGKLSQENNLCVRYNSPHSRERNEISADGLYVICQHMSSWVTSSVVSRHVKLGHTNTLG